MSYFYIFYYTPVVPICRDGPDLHPFLPDIRFIILPYKRDFWPDIRYPAENLSKNPVSGRLFARISGIRPDLKSNIRYT